MTRVKRNPMVPADLRRVAERRFEQQDAGPLGAFPDGEIHRLVHELQVHQIELEMQNAELKRAGEEIETLLDAYTDLVEYAPVGYLVLDPQGEVLQANLTAATLLQQDRSTLVGRSFPFWLEEGGRQPFTAFLAERFAGGGPASCVLPLRPLAEGGRRWLRLEASGPARAGDCRLAFTDITEQHQAEEARRHQAAEAQHAQKLDSLGSLAAGVAHDINNVLGAIYAVTETLQERASLGADVDEALALIEKAALRGRDLVRGLTTFSRKDLQEPERVDLFLLAQQVVNLLEHASFHRVAFSLESEAPSPFVLAQPGQLSGTLMNLCVNALDAMPDGGHLDLRIRRLQGNDLVLSVQDSGCGMAPEVLARATEPFFTTKPLGAGTGLGLSLALATARAHGGDLTVESEPGRGTMVRLRLPECPAPEISRASTLPLVCRSLTVLLVDDDELIRGSLPDLLASRGHRVHSEACGPEALARVEALADLDLVILDQNMPGMIGLEVLQRLRQRHPHLPVILATGNLERGIIDQVAQDRWTRTIEKPYSIATLIHLMNDLIRQSPEP